MVSFKGLVLIFKLIGDDPRCFYEGEIAGKIVNYVKSRSGVLELNDLKEYRVSLGKLTSIEYKGRIIHEILPSIQGIIALHLLKLLEEYDLRSIGLNSSKHVKIFLEIAQIACRVEDLYITYSKYVELPIDYLPSSEFIEALKDEMREEVLGIPLNPSTPSFSLNKNHVNRLKPLEKTMHILSAVMIEDSSEVLVIGLPGDDLRPLLHVQLLTIIW